jgi:pimeloyl-ACP methyl ester carboxylesterase
VRAADPTVAGHVERDGLRLGYEVFGSGEPTLLLLPTWTIVHSRIWKMQVPYLSRHYRVVTYDGPGNGRSDRTVDSDRYTPESYAADAVAVLDHCGVERAVLVGLSLGGAYASRIAVDHPHRVTGVIMIGPALPLRPLPPERARIPDEFLGPYPPQPVGWQKYNRAYWQDHYEDFVRFFFAEMFSEPHSTKQFEDCVGWALETGPDVLVADEQSVSKLAPPPLQDVKCPSLVIHGTDDRIISYDTGVAAAQLMGGSLLTMVGSGHGPLARDPVRVNLAIHDFVNGLGR